MKISKSLIAIIAAHLLHHKESNDNQCQNGKVGSQVFHISIVEKSILFKQVSERGRQRGLELHGLTRHGMIEAQQPGMQTKTMQRVVAITIL